MCKHIHAVARSLVNIEVTKKEKSLEMDIDHSHKTTEIEENIISELCSGNNDKDAERREIKCVFEQILERASLKGQLDFMKKRFKEILSAGRLWSLQQIDLYR